MPDTAWTNLNVADRLAPVVGFGQAECSTARTPGTGGLVPVESALTLYDDVGACNQPTKLLTLQLYLHPVSALDRTRLIKAFSAAAGRPCFAGQQKLNQRSRAQPARVTAWKLNAYVLAVVAQPELGDAVAVSVLATGTAPRPLAPGVLSARSSLLGSLPASCR